jgi:Flp pilus assembly pilin Flp
MELLRRFWSDETGFVVSAELILIATILVIGLIVGLAVLRNQVVQELVDVGQAIGSVSQSFCFSGTAKPFVAWTDGTCYIDLIDFCQWPQDPGEEPGGISVRMFPVGFPRAPTGGELTEWGR